MVTSVKQPRDFKDKNNVNLSIYFNSNLTCIKQPPVFKDHFILSLQWLFKTDLAVRW